MSDHLESVEEDIEDLLIPPTGDTTQPIFLATKCPSAGAAGAGGAASTIFASPTFGGYGNLYP